MLRERCPVHRLRLLPLHRCPTYLRSYAGWGTEFRKRTSCLVRHRSAHQGISATDGGSCCSCCGSPLQYSPAEEVHCICPTKVAAHSVRTHARSQVTAGNTDFGAGNSEHRRATAIVLNEQVHSSAVKLNNCIVKRVYRVTILCTS